MTGLLNPFFINSLPPSLQTTISSLGLTTSLQLVLDAGDLASYDGTSQTWVDVNAGNNFIRGSTTGGQTSDPTFNGTAGRQSASEYFSFDGGDYFQEGSDLAFANSWNKDNAAFTFVQAIYYAHGSSAEPVFYNAENSGDIGVALQIIASDDAPFVNVFSGGGGTALSLNASSALALTTSAWNFYAVAVNEATGANGATIKVNGSLEQFTSTYTSPSASNPSNPIRLGHNGGSLFYTSGTRIGCVAAWNRRLSNSELASLYAAMQPKYGF